VDRLFQILKDSATPLKPLNPGDPERTGAGVPDSVRALSGEAPRPARTPPGGASPDYIATVLEQLREAYVAAGLL
jgi:hypothetical protein